MKHKENNKQRKGKKFPFVMQYAIAICMRKTLHKNSKANIRIKDNTISEGYSGP